MDKYCPDKPLKLFRKKRGKKKLLPDIHVSTEGSHLLMIVVLAVSKTYGVSGPRVPSMGWSSPFHIFCRHSSEGDTRKEMFCTVLAY